MLNPNMNYPYPVIRTYTEDYKSTVFMGDLSVNLQPNGYLIRPNFAINNSGIEDMLAKGIFTYAIEVQSPATWFRKLFIVSNNAPIRLETTSIHERVELAPCIVSTTSFSGFSNDDFEEEYKGLTFDISTGDIIAIGEKRCFDALYQNDIIKNGSSIVSVGGSEDTKEIVCDFSGNIIEITLPIDQYTDYTECGYLKSKYKTLNAILIVPVLVEAIGYIANDENNPDKVSEFESNAWYKTIVANLKRAAENKENKYRQMLEKPFASAEMLLDNNYISALKFVNQVG